MSKAKDKVKEDSDLKLFDSVLKNKSEAWEAWDNAKKYKFQAYCLKIKRLDMVQKIAESAREYLKNQGYIYNPILGWVFPKDVSLAGIKQWGGEWIIEDTERFSLYMEKRKENEIKERKEIYKKQEAKERQEDYDNYMKALLEDGEEPF